jgi:hypothetical protein
MSDKQILLSDATIARLLARDAKIVIELARHILSHRRAVLW